MELWAPVAELELDEGNETDLSIEGNVVRLLVTGIALRQYTVDDEVKFALQTHINGELTVAIFCRDLVYTYGETGKNSVMNMPFPIECAVACAEGAVLGSGTKLYLLRDAMLPLGLVLPSSTSAISKNESVVYFGSKSVNIAVTVSEEGEWATVRVYSIKYLANFRGRGDKKYPRLSRGRNSLMGQPKKRVSSLFAHERVADDSLIFDKSSVEVEAGGDLQKEVVISSIDEFSTQRGSKPVVYTQRFKDLQALYIWNPSSKHLLTTVYDKFYNRLSSDQSPALGVVTLRGFKIGRREYPMAVVLTDKKELILFSPFFNSGGLAIPESDTWEPTEEILSSSENSIVVSDSQGRKRRLLLVTDMEEVVLQSFELLSHILTAEQLYHWLIVYEAAYFLLAGHTSWECFCTTVCACLCDFSETYTDTGDWITTAVEIQKQLPGEKASSPQVTQILILLHMLHEECLLDVQGDQDADKLRWFLQLATSWAGWESWTLYYKSCDLEDSPLGDATCNVISVNAHPPQMSQPPNIYACLTSLLSASPVNIPNLEPFGDILRKTIACTKFFACLSSAQTTLEDMVNVLNRLNLTPRTLDRFYEGVKVPILEILSFVERQATNIGSIEQYELLGRTDLVLTCSSQNFNEPLILDSTEHAAVKDVKTIARQFDAGQAAHRKDPKEIFRLNITRLMFHRDRRFHEANKLLQTSKVHLCSLAQPVDISEHEWLDMQNSLSQVVALRTIAMLFGRAALNFSNKNPLITEKILFTPLEFNIILKESHLTVVFDSTSLSPETLTWAKFYHGAAIGLGISRDATNITGSWIVYNKPDMQDQLFLHAGFLLGLGINGHLKNLEEWHIYNYLGGKEPVLGGSLLVGLCASQLGTANSKLTKVLSVHINALLPARSSDLNVPLSVQTSAMLALGLLYLKTQHRRMTEVLLLELISSNSGKTETYRFACGFSLGLVNFSRGPDLKGLVDMHIVEKLEKLVTYHNDVSTSSMDQRSSLGAIMALMLMFLGSNNQSIAAKLEPPYSDVMASYYRPDLLLVRAMAYHLILWESIGNSKAWIKASIPEKIYLDIEAITVLDSDYLPFFNILSGTLIAMCLRNGATSDPTALETILYYLDEFRRISGLCSVIVTEDERIVHINLGQLQASLVMAAAILVAGRGNIEVFRRLRPLFGSTDQQHDSTPEGAMLNEYAGVGQALGILFLGGGQFSFSGDLFSVGMLAVSVLPLSFAGTDILSLQYLKYFWAFAARSRCLLTIDSDTNLPVRAKVRLQLRSGTVLDIETPSIIPEISSIRQVEVCDNGYLPIVVDFDESCLLSRVVKETRTVYVQTRRPFKSFELSLSSPAKKREIGMVKPKNTSFAILNAMSLSPTLRFNYLWNLRLLIDFAEMWRPHDELVFVSRADIDTLKMNIWRAARAAKSGG